MSPTCMSQSVHQQKIKPKQRNKSKVCTSPVTMKRRRQEEEMLNVELDTKCSCSRSSPTLHHSSIQFSRRYLQCQSSMPISILRSFIQQILPHSSLTQVSIYDSNDRLLADALQLHSLRQTHSSSSLIPLRFTLVNTITSIGHCSCSSLVSFSASSSSSSISTPTIIRPETLHHTLSTCSFPPSPSIVNLLSPPSSDQSMIDEITLQFGEICPPLAKKRRSRSVKKLIDRCSSLNPHLPLDLTLNKRSSTSDLLFSSQAKWIQT